MKAAIIDYGVGNLHSLRCAVQKMGVEPLIVQKPPRLGEVDAVLLPGVGGFTAASERMSSYKDDVLDLVDKGVPLLGICLGMQLLFEESEEGSGEGLSYFRGKVIRLPSNVTVPHMGWNNLHIIKDSFLTEGVEEGSWLYFVHSYFPAPVDSGVVVGETMHGRSFPVLVSDGKVSGTQFHPEKSGRSGLKILFNFFESCRR